MMVGVKEFKSERVKEFKSEMNSPGQILLLVEVGARL